MVDEDRTQRDAKSRINLHEINLEDVVEDPADTKDGDIWRTGAILRAKLGGDLGTIGFTADV